MSTVHPDLRYTQTHEWIKLLEGNTAVVGISDQAQSLLGDLVFVELPEIGQVFEAGSECAVVESVKAASDVYSPVAGRIVEVNQALVDSPSEINHSPYDTGWIFKLEVSDPTAINELLDDQAYTDWLKSEEH